MVVPEEKEINCRTCRWAEWTSGNEAFCGCRDIIPEGSFAAAVYPLTGGIRVRVPSVCSFWEIDRDIAEHEFLEEIRDQLHDFAAEESDGGNGHDRKRA